jgi:hypothetical protein
VVKNAPLPVSLLRVHPDGPIASSQEVSTFVNRRSAYQEQPTLLAAFAAVEFFATSFRYRRESCRSQVGVCTKFEFFGNASLR